MATKSYSWQRLLTFKDEPMSQTDITATLTYTESFSGSTKIIHLDHVDVKCVTKDIMNRCQPSGSMCVECCGVTSLVCTLTGKVLASFDRTTETRQCAPWFPVGTVTYSAPIDVTYSISAGSSKTVNIITNTRGGGCQEFYFDATFTNTIVAPSLNVSCYASSTSATVGSFSAGGSCGTGSCTTRWTLYRGTNASGYVERTGSTSSETFTGLLPNQGYYISVSRSSSYGSASGSCGFTTLTPNNITDEQAKSWDTICGRLFVTNGGGRYAPTTQIQYRKKGSSSWQNGPTSTTTSVDDFCIEGLDEDTCYEVRAQTRTTAGTYTGNTVTVCTPKKCVQGSFTKVEVLLDEKTWESYANVCFDYSTFVSPAKVWVEYRVLNGYDTTWKKTDVIDVDDPAPFEGSACVVLHDLFPNLTTYEYRIVGEAESCYLEGDASQFITPMIPEPDPVMVCKVLTYLSELLCASVHRLYEGNKTIYANDYSKELCDEYSLEPTSLTLWSRFLRWSYAVKCLTCNMADVGMKYGKENQYYVGEAGWTDMLDEVLDDMNVESWRLVTAKGIAKYIAERIHEVWHYHGAVDYILDDLNNVPDDAKIVLNLTDSKVYQKINNKWEIATTIDQPDDFAAYHVNYDSSTMLLHTVKAGTAYYYFQGTWNLLDANIDWLVSVINEIWERKGEMSGNEPGTPLMGVSVKHTDRTTFDCADYPDDERTVIFITEDTASIPPGYYRLTFETGENATIIQDQDVLHGALGQRPVDPEKTGYKFDGWTSKQAPGVEFDWSQPIYGNWDLVAKWVPLPIVVKFNLNGGTGTTPAPVNTFYGMTINPLPSTGFSHPGGAFKGWARWGVPVDETTIFTGDTELFAIWELDEVKVTYIFGNGDSDKVETMSWGSVPAVPADPTWTDHVFIGWFTEDGSEWDFSRAMVVDVKLYAKWVDKWYTVTFNSNGGSQVPSQRIEYMNPAVLPSPAPTRAGYSLVGWNLNGSRYEFSTPVTEDIELVAEWVKTWIVTFDADGGSPAPTPASREIITGNVIQAPQINPRKDGCDFLGWYLEGEEPDPDFKPEITVMSGLVLYESVSCIDPAENPNNWSEFVLNSQGEVFIDAIYLPITVNCGGLADYNFSGEGLTVEWDGGKQNPNSGYYEGAGLHISGLPDESSDVKIKVSTNSGRISSDIEVHYVKCSESE